MRWYLKQDPDEKIVAHLQEVLGVDPIVGRLLAQRGIETFEAAKKFFRPSLEDLHDPFLMADMTEAVHRILNAIKNRESILVFGDYDVDGTTSVALMYSYLKSLGAQVDTYIPDRYNEGYGISYQGIDYAITQGIHLIIALDCGIKSIEHIQYAKEKGVDFIICDHHLPGEIIPDAVAVLDPKRVDCLYPYKELCGCGVGFKLIQALNTIQGLPFASIEHYLDLVATAIAADVVPITGENRVLAYYGLKVINESPRPGIKALMKLYDLATYTMTDIVFKLAPKINAAGRIEHGNFTVDLLTEATEEGANMTVEKIVNINEERKSLDQGITEEALKQIIDQKLINSKSTVVYSPSWHKGVIGIVASRLIDTYYRPTIVFTDSGDYLAASARSVKNFDIYQALEKCSEHLIQFGGHMYAAGLTIKKENLEAFRQKFEEVVASTIEETDLIPEIEIDAKIQFSEITDKFLRILKQFEPFGPGNPSPCFLTKEVFDTGYAKLAGARGEHLKVSFKQRRNPGYKFSAIGFNLGAQYENVKDKQHVDIIYSIEENNWRNKTTIQLQIKDLQLSW
ncbi:MULTISPECIES: single-stranded-DNA-specific exonuclease RecJ [Myroides]|uniref:Single-stranded-DNA-specific exonuclease RecJ n=2 Tax=Myroides odoratimimus TaxID=76832 RepID=A0A0S7E512_9FLAO|nr:MULTISPECIES: single-stranded-DNA-specific exonuclease RecJ [Myroides]AJA68592.1 single-stranded-DNA-specific exonuclease RecJ [Myroides sp. A21]ALU25865.1 single-stranded-DNA-specific exonuclease RecJ [Myroides odoratimimus]EHO11252.1 single-stranded-DNA-specific exonuclease RecJ [Myroides odoratimimus CCUG 10230]EHO14539.1 single-stranded-DNA-specific exonuclease RecJ [Myroides odoratimimus CCUG 12901]MDM1033196.1 single-stranded-DNA-specific exonuclease RecJ [Myroides odoratimimus]